jgi:hypothetical protein
MIEVLTLTCGILFTFFAVTTIVEAWKSPSRSPWHRAGFTRSARFERELKTLTKPDYTRQYVLREFDND